jgi:hypothetical protein
MENEADDPSLHDGLIAEINAIAAETEEKCRSVVHPEVENVASMLPDWAAGYFVRERRHYEVCGKILEVMVGPGWPWSDSWKTTATVAIASEIYDSHDWKQMPILADALTDTGCDERVILGYCRGDGPFCRGCWILDEILDKRE